MGFFSKKNKQGNQEDLPEEVVEKHEQPDSKKVSDKSIKPRAPKSMVGKRIGRTVFWIFMCFLLLKGALSFAQGTRVIQQVTNIGNDTPAVSDNVKGFAADFATEFFSWEANHVAERNSRLSKFVSGVESGMGLKSYDVKASSRVTSVEVYSTNIIDDKHIDVTVFVWREVQPLSDQIEVAQGTATAPPTVMKKTYMIVPITLAQEGPVIQSNPRFVSEQQKGDTIDTSSRGTSITDSALKKRGTELADSYLRSWYEGNASQMKYFYADSVKSPDNIPKSDFTYDKLEKIMMFNAPDENGQKMYQIEVDVIVKSDLEEPFTNSWKLEVTEKEGRLYVISNGILQQEIKIPTPAATESISPDPEGGISTEVPIPTTIATDSGQSSITPEQNPETSPDVGQTADPSPVSAQ